MRGGAGYRWISVYGLALVVSESVAGVAVLMVAAWPYYWGLAGVIKGRK